MEEEGEIKIEKVKKIITEEEKKKKSEYLKQWRKDNPERVKYLQQRWRDEHREKVNESSKQHYLNRKEKKLAWGKKYYQENIDWIAPRNQKYRDSHKEETNLYHKNKNRNLKIEAFNLLGGCRCAICGDENLDHLTIDHIDGKGGQYRKNNEQTHGVRHIHRAIIKGSLTEVELKNLRVLCWNHNSSRTREYLDEPAKNRTISQAYRVKLWKETFNFFGPCACGIKELKFLTISHIHNNGAEERKNNKGMVGGNLIQKFRNLGWPGSLKEDYCLECWNCNCGRSITER